MFEKNACVGVVLEEPGQLSIGKEPECRQRSGPTAVAVSSRCSRYFWNIRINDRHRISCSNGDDAGDDCVDDDDADDGR